MFSLEEYKEAVRYFASSHKNYNIKNEGDNCARVVFANLFLNAKKRIRMVANTLRNAVVDSQEYQDGLDSFLARKDAKLEILIHHLPETAREDVVSNIYRRLSRNPAFQEGRVEIKIAGHDCFFLAKKPINFCVADGLMYRLEDDIEKRTAICNFGDKRRAEELEAAFDRVFASVSETVNLGTMFAR